MDITIRPGEEKDLPTLHEMILELADFVKAKKSVSNTVERMKEEQNMFSSFVAEQEGEIIGAAIYFFAYFTWTGKSLFLDDLYVKPEFRNKKVGSKLLRQVFELAKEENCHKVRWQVFGWNTNAVEFYKKIKAEFHDGWSNCDFDSAGINDFLNSKFDA